MKSASIKVARRYARAIAQLCEERGDGEQVRATFSAIDAALTSVPGALVLLANPTLPLSDRKAMLTALADGCGAQGTAKNAVLLLLDKGRISAFSAIRTEFNALLDQKTGRAEATVVSAVALDAAATKRLQALMTRLVGKEVSLTASVDPALIGGLVVRVGNTVYDASVANHLARLRQSLAAA